ncbi:MAG TPA: sulfatase-like hydrolase/transferase [Polyangiaceae bacterium]|nr:sulfatase-like hydrolase/transferase [Polyangiaceae bacterium]
MTLPSNLRRVSRGLLTLLGISSSALFVALGVGMLDGALAWFRSGTTDETLTGMAVCGAALIGALALPIALGEWLLLGLGRLGARGPIARKYRRARAWVRLASSRAPHIGRLAVVRTHAALLSTLLVLAGFCAGYWLFAERVLRVQVEHIKLGLLVGSGLLALVVAPLLVLALSALFRPVFARIDEWVRLPLPPWRGSRSILFVWLPLLFAVVVVYAFAQAFLGILRWPLLFAGFVALQAIVLASARVLRSFRRRRTTRSGRVSHTASAVLLFASLGAFIWIGTRLGPTSPAIRALPHGVVLPSAIEWARQITDFDRDGASRLFGGLDCAGGDPKRNPDALEIPDNGIDEDCDGRDAVSAGVDVAPPPKLEVFSGRLNPSAVRRYNIVWAVIDAVRADHTSLLGYKRRTTPYMELIEKEALTFSHAYSQSSSTLFSLPSTFTGTNPTNLTWRPAPETEHLPDWHEPDLLQLADEHETAAELFGSAGYRTAINMSTYMVRSHPGLKQGYERVLDLWIAENLKWGVRSSPVATTQAIQLMEEFRRDPKRPDSPFFLTVYYEDPHGPYGGHDEGYPEFGRTQMDYYDWEIAFADRHVGFLYEYLRHTPELWDNTIFIVTSDHGEEFNEHGHEWHSKTCHIESVHVPLLVRVPGVPAQRIDTPVALVDILPTLVELTGVRRPNNRVDGQSLLVPALAPQLVKKARPIFCAVGSQRKGLVPFYFSSIRVRNSTLTYKLPFGRLGLYDVYRDPGEQRDIFNAQSWTSTVKTLRAWLSQENAGNLPEATGFAEGDG